MKRILVLTLALAACDDASQKTLEEQAKEAAEKAAKTAGGLVDKAGKEVGKAVAALPMDINEKMAASALRDIHVVQVAFKEKDLDRNDVKDYWTADVAGLYCVRHKTAESSAGGLAIDIASADASPYKGAYASNDYQYDKGMLKPHAAKAGYVYRMMEKAVDGALYATDPDRSGKKVHHTSAWAACAVPEKYGSTGKLTYIINQNAEMFRKDTAGKPVVQWPTEKVLGKEWEKVP